jgi:hypothetical protein
MDYEELFAKDELTAGPRVEGFHVPEWVLKREEHQRMRQEGRDLQRLRDERKAWRNCGVRGKGPCGGAVSASAEEAELTQKENKAAAIRGHGNANLG